MSPPFIVYRYMTLGVLVGSISQSESMRGRLLLYLKTFPYRAGPMLLVGSILALHRSGFFMWLGILLLVILVAETVFLALRYIKRRR